MLFKIGMTVVIVSGVAVFYLNSLIEKNTVDKFRALTEPVEFSKNENVPDIDRKDEIESLAAVKNDVNKGTNDTSLKEKLQTEKGKKKVKGKKTKVKDGKGPVPAGLKPTILKPGGKLQFREQSSYVLHLSVVACGDRAEETIILLKSAILFTKAPLVFHIFAETDLQTYFQTQIELWPEDYISADRLEYRIYDITLPPGDSENEWKNLFKPCASQRLFLPSLLNDVDSLIYVDTDVLFVSPLEKLWEFFSSFNSSQLVALAPEHEDPSIGWYNRFARHPYYGPLGVNSGVMLMNLTRLRQTRWLPEIMEYYKEYRLKITWGDQDLINVYFYFHPDQLFLFSCEWNYRPDHCMYMSVCKKAEEVGAQVLHGCRRVMHNDKQPAFKAFYITVKEYQFGGNMQYHLLEKLRINLEKMARNTHCGHVPEIFTKQMEKNILQHQP